jgi:two-component system, OmpR family, response regulator
MIFHNEKYNRAGVFHNMTTVLIVDDNPAIRQLFDMTLVVLKYHTLTAPGGEECLNILQTTKPDIILLDIMMEPMDGWQTLEQIKACEDTKTIPVIMVTGKALTEDDRDKFGTFYADYLMKPVSPQRLQERIEHALHAAADIKPHQPQIQPDDLR